MQDNIIVFPEPPAGDTAGLVTHNLPVSLTSLIGREQEMQAIQALLSCPDVRLLTLTGTPGVGKTRLALEVARNLLHAFADGVFFVSLAPLSDPDLVIPTIAHRLGLMESGSEPILDLLKLSQRDKHRLLVLDNFEQVIETSPLLTELLEACLDVKLLVTSREVLRLRGEQQFSVMPLALPDARHLPDDRPLTQVPSVNLFLQRAQAIQSDFQLTPDNAAIIAEICLRLDGLPLAIELAAVRIRLFPPKALLDRLHHRLHILTGGARDLPERQQTLRTTLQWSYNLLSEEEQRLFRRLSIFVGGCTLEAVEAVYATLGNRAAHVTDGMASLIDKSLLHQTGQEREEEFRFVLLETLREYGLEALAANEEMWVIRQAHAHYYLALAEEAEPELVGPQQAEWLERLEREHDNLRAVLQWLVEQEEIGQSIEMALRLGGALRRFWRIRGYYHEGLTFLEWALARSEGISASVQVKGLQAAASLAINQGEADRAEALSQESLALCRECGDTTNSASSLYWLAEVAWVRGNLATARLLAEEALSLCRKLDDKGEIAWALLTLAAVDTIHGEYSRASALYEESVALHRQVGNKRGIADSLFRLAEMLFVSQGDQATIHSLLEESLTLSREVGDKRGIADCFCLSGRVALGQSNAAAARSLLEEALSLFREIGDQQGTALSLSCLARVEVHQGNHAAARAFYQENLAMMARGVDDKGFIASFLEGLAGVVATQGEPAWAVKLWGSTEALRDRIGRPIPPVELSNYQHAVAAARAQLNEQAFAAAWAEGRTLTLDQVLVALEQAMKLAPVIESSSAPAARKPASNPDGLTAREVEVLRLLAQGLTSAQVAEQLVIGVVTVNFHVRSIYSKLRVTSRSAATRYALEHHLV